MIPTVCPLLPFNGMKCILYEEPTNLSMARNVAPGPCAPSQKHEYPTPMHATVLSDTP